MEHDEQKSLIQWAKKQACLYPALAWLFAIPNGAQYGKDRRLAIIQAQKMKSEGLLPGVPDLFLPYPARGFAGFFIEMKAPGKMKEVRPGQAAFMAWAESVGYLCQVHDSFEGAQEALLWYVTPEQ